MEYAAVLIVVLLVFSFLAWDRYRQEKANLKRYASILEDMHPGIRYPKWRLEEMLASKNRGKK